VEDSDFACGVGLMLLQALAVLLLLALPQGLLDGEEEVEAEWRGQEDEERLAVGLDEALASDVPEPL
jgi:hypothetical protein